MSGSRNISSWIKAAVVLSAACFKRQQGCIFLNAAHACSGMSGGGNLKDKRTDMGSRFAKSGPCAGMQPAEALRKLYGYEFKDGKMVDENGQPFNFELHKCDRAANQKRYEHIGEIITEYVYDLLQEEGHLEKKEIPLGAKKSEEKGFFFLSHDEARQHNDKLMILIHGAGVVRAGQWARRKIINDDLDSGTMLPYIKRAQENGFAVLIPNGNHGGWKQIRGSETPEAHFAYIWRNFIEKSNARTIVTVAHSQGGVVAVNALRSCTGFKERVKAVAFTDSVHSTFDLKKEEARWLRKHSRNWVSSDYPLDYPLGDSVVSAGTPEHVSTSHAALESVFKFFGERLGDSRPSGQEPMEEDVDSKNENTNGSNDQTGGTSDEGSKSNEDHVAKGEGTKESKSTTSKDQTGATSDQGGDTEDKKNEDGAKVEDTEGKLTTSKDQTGVTSDQGGDTEDKKNEDEAKVEDTEGKLMTSNDQTGATSDQGGDTEDKKNEDEAKVEDTEGKLTTSKDQTGATSDQGGDTEDKKNEDEAKVEDTEGKLMSSIECNPTAPKDAETKGEGEVDTKGEGKGDQKEQKTTDERSSGKNNGAANPDNVQLQHNKLPKSDL